MTHRTGLLLVLALLLAAPVLFAQESVDPAPFAADSTAVAPADTTAQAVLTEFANGLRLLVLERPEWKLTWVNTYLSLRGAARNGGMAHLVEHLMFRSSENCPAGSLRDSLTLLTTTRRGTTSPRNVNTRSACLPALLPRLLHVEAERYGRLRPDSTDLAHEVERVLGEGDFRKEYYTRTALNLRVIAMAYEGDAAAGDPLLGSAEDLAAVGLADADSFITTWLRPDRTVVLVAGPVDPDSVRAQVAATFGTWTATGPAPEARDLPPRPDPRRFVTRSDDRSDLLAVGFRLPYGTPAEAAIVHLTESIMDREDGRPSLYIFEDEALLILHVWGKWSTERSDSTGAQRAVDQFWRETRTVKHRVRNDWLFQRNREAHVEELRERLNQPYRRAQWRAQRLADGRDLPDPDVLAAMVDSLPQESIREFFDEQFISERSFIAFAAGRAPSDPLMMFWNRGIRLNINPYLLAGAGPTELQLADIEPVLAAATKIGVGQVQKDYLPNGIPVHLLELEDEDDVHLGGFRTFPDLKDEAPSRDPGRLRIYEWLTRAGYDSKGRNIEPRGEKPGWNTDIDVDVSSLEITAHGPVDRFEDVAAAMHKRLAVDRLDPFVLKWYREQHHHWIPKFVDLPPARSWDWRTQQIFGPDHPRTGFTRPDIEAVQGWSVGGANKLHRQVCETGNLELVVVGEVDPAAVRAVFDPTFGRLDEARPGSYPTVVAGPDSVAGVVVPNRSSTVAAVEFTFPPRPLADEPSLGPIDMLVLERLAESRLRLAIAAAELDSASARVWVLPRGASAMAVVRCVCHPADAARILELVRAETQRFTSEPPTAAEEARARLLVMGPLLHDLMDADDACDLLVSCAQFGRVPADALAALAGREYGLVTPHLGGLFPPDRYAWTITGDPDLGGIRELGPELK